MNQFTVPQFIDVEDKILGPVTTRQFILMLACFIMIAIFYKIFDFSLFVFTALLNFIIFGVISFAKINGRPFHFFLLNVIQTLKRPSLRVWYKHPNPPLPEVDESKAIEKNIDIKPKERPAVSRLAELSLIVDTQGVYKGEGDKGSVGIKVLDKKASQANQLDIIK